MTGSEKASDARDSKAPAERRAEVDAPSNSVRLAALLTMLWLIAGLAAVRTGDSASRSNNTGARGIDPNTAAWWELSSLPQIGVGLAKDIVAYRDKARDAAARPFRRAADLEDVPGIGPITVQRIAKHLRFDER